MEDEIFKFDATCTTQGSENSRIYFRSNNYTASMKIPELKINLNYFDEIIICFPHKLPVYWEFYANETTPLLVLHGRLVILRI